MNPTDTIRQPCQPYDLGPGRDDPVDIWAVIDRLTPAQQRRMLLAFAVQDPRHFEDALRRVGPYRR